MNKEKEFTDSHLHLYKEYYDDVQNILINAKDNLVTRYINNGTDNLSNKEILNSIKKYPGVYGAIGIHPENVDNYLDSDLNFIEEHLNDKKVIAIGEIGLDYHYTKENKNEQIKLLEYQLELATKYHKPVIIHSRDATKDTIDILKKYKVKGIIHSFSGSIETAKEYIKMGYLLGVNGVVTFKNANLKDTIINIPLEYLVLETDSPYLTPEPFRGQKNNPSHILDIAKFVSNLKNISLEDLASITNANLERIFNFDVEN